jgi:MoxR-like ATPase
MRIPRNPKFLKIDGTVQVTTWEEVLAAVERMREYFRALKLRFIDRDELLDKILLALMLREHVMIHGDTGTGKSALVRSVMRGIQGATIWRMDLAKSVTDAQLFGPYDVRVMREDGRYVHMTDGNLPEANFAELGEFFDASPYALRSLLGALNEREVRRGPQIMTFPLLTAFADSNISPEDLNGREEETLRAVVDRFLFHHKVDYVRDERDRVLLGRVALERTLREPLPPLSLTDIVLVSGVIQYENLILDPYLLEAYQAITFRFATEKHKASGRWLPDRRYCNALQVLEASALLHGRIEPNFEDLGIIDEVIPINTKEREMLKAARHDQMKVWIDRASRREIEQEEAALGVIVGKVPSPDLAQLGQVELDRLRDMLGKLREELKGFEPKSVEVGTRQVQAHERIGNLQHQAELRLVDVLAENLPVLPDPIPNEQLTPFMGQVRRVLQGLEALSPTSPELLGRHGQALVRARQMQADLTVAFIEQTGHEPPKVGVV